MNEITTRAERAQAVEPQPTLTVGDVERLLHAAAVLEAARRPIHVHQAAAPAVTVLPTEGPQVLPRHSGIDVRVPAPAEAEGLVPWAPIRHRKPTRRPWGPRVAVTGMGLLVTGAGVAAVTDGSAAAILACALGITGAVGGVALAVNEEHRAERAS